MEAENEHNCINSDDLLNETELNIEKFGLEVILVTATNYSPSFAYSIGLTRSYNHPEVICFGLPQDLAHAIINDVAELIKNGKTIKVGEINHEVFEGSRATFLEVDQRNIGDYFAGALNYYGEEKFTALELIWTDQNDRFPWEEDFEEQFLHKQPLLDRNADFKFSEAKNLATFTTRQWVENHKPILRVVHDADGDWQFLTGDQMAEDIRIVALEQLILRDNTLNEVFDLEYGQSAERDFPGGRWTKTKLEDEDS